MALLGIISLAAASCSSNGHDLTIGSLKTNILSQGAALGDSTASAACNLTGSSEVRRLFANVEPSRASAGSTPEGNASTCVYSARGLRFSLVVAYYQTMGMTEFEAHPWQTPGIQSSWSWSIPSLEYPVEAWSFYGQGQLAFRKNQRVVVLSFAVDFDLQSPASTDQKITSLARQIGGRL
jgi:hypothetical protein